MLDDGGHTRVDGITSVEGDLTNLHADYVGDRVALSGLEDSWLDA
jgi:hypothetical protein